MAVVRVKPTSPGRRFLIKAVNCDLHKGRAVRSLTAGKRNKAGRNNVGRITVRHQGGGHKRRIRLVDFKRRLDHVPARVNRIEYDPNRSAHLALLVYENGVKSYIIAPKGLSVGDIVLSGEGISQTVGNSLPLESIADGTTLHCVELLPGRGAQMGRSAGSAIQLLAKEGGYALLRLSSGEERRVLSLCRATIGSVGNHEHSLLSLGKAGRKRWMNIRPTVRGTAMNPVDHPHGGGEGRNFGQHPVTPWGVPTKGYRTRSRKKASARLILRHRNQAGRR